MIAFVSNDGRHYFAGEPGISRLAQSPRGVTHYTSTSEKRRGSDGSGHAPLCALVRSNTRGEVRL